MPENVNFNLQIVCLMSCNITVSVSDDFAKEAKRLAKKYPSFKQDYKEFLESIKNNPLQGDEITKNIRKICREYALYADYIIKKAKSSLYKNKDVECDICKLLYKIPVLESITCQ